MATYIIGYDLNSPGQNYEDLFEKIKSIAGGWWHHLDSTWIITHNGPASTIRDALTPHIDTNDELLVVKSGGEGAWCGFNVKGSEWLKENL
jgi:hypothetical protein